MRAAVTEDPRITRSRSLILDASAAAFLQLGYEGTSVDDVAHRAGVAKRTVYNIYGDKEALFRATISRSIVIAERFAAALADASSRIEDVGKDLPALAVRLAEDVVLGPVLPLRRLLVSESSRFPDLAAEYRDRAPDAVLRGLAEAFATLSARGLLAIDEPDVAAEQFAFLVMGADLDRGMFALAPRDPAAVRSRALSGVGVFLRAYAPDPR